MQITISYGLQDYGLFWRIRDNLEEPRGYILVELEHCTMDW